MPIARKRRDQSLETLPLLEPLENRRLYAADGKLSLVHQELHRPPTALLTWGTGLAFRVATATHTTNDKGIAVVAVDVYGNSGGDLKLISHTDCDDNDPAAAIYLAAGDVDGDGFTDIALKLFSVTGQPTPVGEAFNSTITILDSNGKDGFTPRTPFVLPHVLEKSVVGDPHVLDKTGLAVGDVNGDGSGDILSWSGDDSDIAAMPLTARGGPRQTTSQDGTFSHGTIKGNGRIAGIADLDGDGRLDIIGFDEDAPTVFYGTFDASVGVKLVKRIEFEVTKLGVKFDGGAPSDLDGDTFADDLVLFSGNDVYLATNNSKTDPATGQSVISLQVTSTVLPPKVASTDVLVGDVTGDGKAELFTLVNKKKEFTGHITLIK